MIAHRDAGPDDRRPHTVYADKPARCQSYMERLKQVWLFDLIWGGGVKSGSTKAYGPSINVMLMANGSHGALSRWVLECIRYRRISRRIYR